MRTRVKICGITRPEDAFAAARLGADAIGLVFYRKSPRWVSVARARECRAFLPPFVTTVGLFVNAAVAEVGEVLGDLPLDLLQFHGDEPASFCRQFGRPYIKAIRMRDGIDLPGAQREYADAVGLLLDTYAPDTPGGTGRSFDWRRVPADLAPKIVLAGGLDPENVEKAILEVRPYAVDVSGGVEKAKGIKDIGRIEAFMRGVQRGDRG